MTTSAQPDRTFLTCPPYKVAKEIQNAKKNTDFDILSVHNMPRRTTLRIATLSGISGVGKTTFCKTILGKSHYIYLVEMMRKTVENRDPKNKGRGSNRSIWWEESQKLFKQHGADVFHKDALRRIAVHIQTKHLTPNYQRRFCIDGFRRMDEVRMFSDLITTCVRRTKWWKGLDLGFDYGSAPSYVTWAHFHIHDDSPSTISDGLTDITTDKMRALRDTYPITIVVRHKASTATRPLFAIKTNGRKKAIFSNSVRASVNAILGSEKNHE